MGRYQSDGVSGVIGMRCLTHRDLFLGVKDFVL